MQLTHSYEQARSIYRAMSPLYNESQNEFSCINDLSSFCLVQIKKISLIGLFSFPNLHDKSYR